MDKTKAVGALKSWTCVVVLTFLVPTGAFQLSNIVYAATAQAGHGISAFLSPADAGADTLLTACPEFSGEKAL